MKQATTDLYFEEDERHSFFWIKSYAFRDDQIAIDYNEIDDLVQALLKMKQENRES